MHFPLQKNTSLKAAATCLNNRSDIVAEYGEYDVHIAAEYEMSLLKRCNNTPFKAHFLPMCEGNIISLKGNDVTLLPKQSPAVLRKVAPF